jgi:peptidoglycan/LPS O-acetylase OafA/YrhL
VRKELLGLTSLRGIAAVGVMFHNLSIFCFGDIAADVPSRLVGKLYLLVDLFFVLSGFVLAYVYGSSFSRSVAGVGYRKFMLARFARIYPLHIATLVILIVFECLQLWMSQSGLALQREPFTDHQTPVDLVLNVLLLQVFTGNSWNRPGWSISTEWLIYFAVPFLILLVARATATWRGLGVLACLAALIWMELRFGDLGMFYAGWPMLVRCLAECTLGIMLHTVWQRGARPDRRAVRFVTPLGVATFASLVLPLPHVLTVVLLCALVFCAAAIVDPSQHWLACRWLVRLGTISYSIYMLHWPVQQLLLDGVYAASGRSLVELVALPALWMALLATMALVVLLSNPIYAKVEQAWRTRVRRSAAVRRTLRLPA